VIRHPDLNSSKSEAGERGQRVRRDGIGREKEG